MNTSQPNHNPDGSDDLDILLGAAYTRLVNDLTATFDLDTGAAQATHPATYSALTNDLAQQLDLDAGLAAIVTSGSLPPPNDTQPHQPASPPLAMDQLQDLEHLRFLDAPTRLALRAAPAFRNLRDILELGELIVRALNLTEHSERAPTINFDPARALDLALNLDLARQLARTLDLDLVRNLVRTLDLALDLVRTLDLALDRSRTRDVACILDLVHDLDRSRDLALDLVRALDRARSRDLALVRALDRARSRDPALALVRALDRARSRDLAFDLARPIGDAFQLALTVALGLTHHAASGYGRILGLRLDLGQRDRLDQSAVTWTRMALAKFGDDFVGADLRSVQMIPDIVGLEGVRWSNDTQWPSEWVDYVRAASDEIEHGIFQITRIDGRRSPTYAAT